MNKRVNFEDNIYVLLMRIKMLRDLFALDADPEIFLEKTLDDIDFIDNALKTLLAGLLENRRLIEREDLLSHISELEWQFGEVLNTFLNSERTLSVREIPALKERIMVLRAASGERRLTAESSGAGEKQPDEPLVSANELNELLNGL